jgi:hypothetical protein
MKGNDGSFFPISQYVFGNIIGTYLGGPDIHNTI